MKNILIFTALLGSLFTSCIQDDGLIFMSEDETEILEVPVANSDSYEVVVNSVLTIDNLLENDDTFEFAYITSFQDASVEGGTIESRGNNLYLYTPPFNFLGSDSFTYTICNNADLNDCSTGVVSIMVKEAESINLLSLFANDDNFRSSTNTAITLNVLTNDNLLEGIIETELSFNDDNLLGSIVLNSDSSFTYEPSANFEGLDTFTYTVCNVADDTDCSVAEVTINIGSVNEFNIPSDLLEYYEDVLFFNDSSLILKELNELMIASQTTFLQYTQRHDFLYDADADLDNEANVILFYTGESRNEEEYAGNPDNSSAYFNTEHVYPQSFLPLSDQEHPSARDLHLLRACEAGVNTSRSNLPFVDAEVGTMAGRIDGGWYPGDEWIGDVARIVLYVNMYYDEPIDDVGALETFLQWNIEDPVSEFEIQRNDVIEDAQGNRNPFIDNPYLATLIWGGEAAENTWE